MGAPGPRTCQTNFSVWRQQYGKSSSMGGIPCRTHGMGHNVAAIWRRSAAALQRLALQLKFETAIYGWQKHYCGRLRPRSGVNGRPRMAISFDRRSALAGGIGGILVAHGNPTSGKASTHWSPQPQQYGCRSNPRQPPIRPPSTGCVPSKAACRAPCFPNQCFKPLALLRTQPHDIPLHRYHASRHTPLCRPHRNGSKSLNPLKMVDAGDWTPLEATSASL